MHRFTLKKVFSLCCIYAGLVQAGPFSTVEQSWIDAHPVVRFSIHEKYAPYLAASNKGDSAGPFKALLSKMEECTRQQYVPVWRKSDSEGLKQLGRGEVDFIIDPPSIDDHVLQFGSLSEAIFWGHDVVVTKTSNKLESPNLKIAYFDRGLENAPTSADSHNQHQETQSAKALIQSLVKSDIEALVMPIRLARRLLEEYQNSDLRIDGLYSRDPFAYRWLISDHAAPLRDILSHFLDDLDPIASRQLFALGGEPGQKSSMLPWLGTTLLFLFGGTMFYQLQRKYFHQKQATV